MLAKFDKATANLIDEAEPATRLSPFSLYVYICDQ